MGKIKGLELANHHIVYEVSSLGEVNAKSALNVAAAAPIPGEGGVVIVQKGAVSPVHAVAECAWTVSRIPACHLRVNTGDLLDMTHDACECYLLGLPS